MWRQDDPPSRIFLSPCKQPFKISVYIRLENHHAKFKPSFFVIGRVHKGTERFSDIYKQGSLCSIMDGFYLRGYDVTQPRLLFLLRNLSSKVLLLLSLLSLRNILSPLEAAQSTRFSVLLSCFFFSRLCSTRS